MKRGAFAVFVLTALTISACGKPQVDAISGGSGEGSFFKPKLALDLSESATRTDGALVPLSDYDLKQDPVLSKVGLPFEIESGKIPSFSTFRYPRSTISEPVKETVSKDSDSSEASSDFKNAGDSANSKTKQNETALVSERSSLVFRSIQQVPPRTAIRSVRVFKLTLTAPRVHSKEAQKLSQGQSLCFLDGAACLGDLPEMAKEGSFGGNQKFWKSAEVYGVDFLESARWKESGKTKEGSTLYSHDPVDLEIDFLSLLNLSPTSAVDFIFKHSANYSSEESGFRKFRFALGDRAFAQGGALVLEFDTDSARIPKGYEKRLPVPLFGSADLVNQGSKRRQRLIRGESARLEDKYLWILSPAENQKDSITEVVRKLSAARGQIEEIRVVSRSIEKPSLELANSVREEFLQAGWSKESVLSLTKVEEGAEPSVGIAVKFMAAVENDAKQRKQKIVEILQVSGEDPATGEDSIRNDSLLEEPHGEDFKEITNLSG